MKPRLTYFAPQFLVDDLARSMSYYAKLGFTFGEPWEGFYAIGQLDRLELHMKEAPKNLDERRHRRDNEHLDASAGVDGIEALQSIRPQSLCHLGAADMKERYTTLPHHGRIQVWDIERLWQHAKDLPVTLMPLHAISDYDTVCWYGTPSNWGRLTCREVVEHIQRINVVTFDTPILLSAEGRVMDGFHRLAKAHLLGMSAIPAVQFAVTPQPDAIERVPAWLSKLFEPVGE